MQLLEEHFLRKFEPHDGGYLFHQADRSVLFTRAEVEGFVAARRRTWSNPWLWGGWLLIGVAVPVMLGLSGGEYSGEQAVLLALVSTVVLAVVLNHAESGAADAAQARATVGPGKGKPVAPWWWYVFFYPYFTYIVVEKVLDAEKPWWSRAIFFGLGLMLLWQIFDFVRGLRKART